MSTVMVRLFPAFNSCSYKKYHADIMKDDEEEEQAVGNEQPAGLAASDIPHPAEVPEPAPSTPAQISSPPSTPSP